jgi:replicative DNA helicase
MPGRLFPPAFIQAIDAAVLARAGKPERGETRFRCPSGQHEDRHPSARWNREKGTWWCDACGAGGGALDLADRLGVEKPDQRQQGGVTVGKKQGDNDKRPFPWSRRTEIGPVVATYAYRDPRSVEQLRVTRHETPTGKTIRPWHQDARGEWVVGTGDVPPLPYRLPELLAADPAEPVFIGEGEKVADALAEAGLIATTNAGGANKWPSELGPWFEHRHVVILPDNDEPGREHAEAVATALFGTAASVKVLDLSSLPPKGDAYDWLAAGGTAEELRRLAAVAPEWRPPEDAPGAPTSEDSADAEDIPWLDPMPLLEGDRPPFPTSTLPAVLRAFVEALAEATQTPAALPAMLGLAAIATAAAKRVTVRVRNGWHEPVNLYVVVALDSGNRKSAVLREVAAPLRAYEREQARELAVEIAQVESRRKIAEKALERAQREASNPDGANYWQAREEADRLARDLIESPELRVPRAPRLLVDDITPEKLAAMMLEHGGRMAVLSAEGGLFDIMSGRFSKDGKAPSLDLFLRGHAGDDLPVDRLGRTGGVLVNPALTMGLAVQLYVFRGLANRPGFRGTGALARYAFGLPTSFVGRRKVNPPPVPQEATDAYAKVVQGILALPLPDEANEQGALELVLSSEAAQRFLDFERALEPRLGSDGDLGHIADWGGKLAGLVARLAGLFHVVACAGNASSPGDRTISGATMQDAITLAREFLIPHAITAFGEMGADPVLEDARIVLRKLERWDDTTFSRRDLHQRSLKGRFRQPDELDRPLHILAAHGYIRPAVASPTEKPRRGRPSDRYEINPALRSQNPQNPQKAQPETFIADSEDFADGFRPSDREADDAVFADAVRELLKLEPAEIAAYRAELDEADPGDPFLDFNRAVLARAEKLLRTEAA